ncbi:GDP-mannose 4,6-dehydratase [soil metagenome]
MPGWIVTGTSGFLGRHLLDALLEQGPEAPAVSAIGRRRPTAPIPFHKADLEDLESLNQALCTIRPDVVLHLAGRTPPADPQSLYRANLFGTLNLLEALRRLDRPVRVVLAGSAAEFGPVEPEHLPVVEAHPCRPTTPYGLSKYLATCAALASRPPLEAVVGRIFNPIGPGMPSGQVFGRFAAELARPGLDPLRLSVGDLDARRDFIDARDVASALIALARSGRPGRVYNIGNGHSQRVGEGLNHLIRLSGRRVLVETDASWNGHGPTDSRADIGCLVYETGWSPRFAFEQSLADLWRSSQTALTLMTSPAVV